MTWDYGCQQTGKRRYPSLNDARLAAEKTTRRGWHQQKTYQCEFCSGWHMTHILHETRPKDWHKRKTKQAMI